MALKDAWRDLVDSTNGVGGDDVSVKPINDIAHAVINLEEAEVSIEIDTELSDLSKNPVQNRVITLELNKKANIDEVFEEVAFGWTDYEHSEINADNVDYDDDSISGAGTVIIHCMGESLGFTVQTEMYQIDNFMIINGERIELSETPYTLPITYMEDDIVIEFGIGSCMFTGMRKKILKGIGDLSSALDAIISLENSLIGGEV